MEKIYPINSKRKTKDGTEYIYKNYEVFVPYDFLDLMGVKDHMYLYLLDDEVYITSVQPDGSVPAKRLSVHKQRGSPQSRKMAPEKTKNNKWKRFFIVPKKFFPHVSEDKVAVFTLDPTKEEKFSGNSCTLKMELYDI